MSSIAVIWNASISKLAALTIYISSATVKNWRRLQLFPYRPRGVGTRLALSCFMSCILVGVAPAGEEPMIPQNRSVRGDGRRAPNQVTVPHTIKLLKINRGKNLQEFRRFARRVLSFDEDYTRDCGDYGWNEEGLESY